MKSIAALFLAILLAIPACTTSLPKPPRVPADGRILVRIDQNFGQMGIEAITSAISEWYAEASICFDVQVVDVSEEYETWPDDGVTTIYFCGEGTWPKAVFDIFEKRSGITNPIGFTLMSTKDVFLSDEYFALRQVAMHEIGHVLGIAQHSTNRTSTMYHIALSGGFQRVTKEDAALAAKLNPTHRCR